MDWSYHLEIGEGIVSRETGYGSGPRWPLVEYEPKCGHHLLVSPFGHFYRVSDDALNATGFGAWLEPRQRATVALENALREGDTWNLHAATS